MPDEAWLYSPEYMLWVSPVVYHGADVDGVIHAVRTWQTATNQLAVGRNFSDCDDDGVLDNQLTRSDHEQNVTCMTCIVRGDRFVT